MVPIVLRLPLTLAIIRHVEVAKVALETQRQLIRLGYDAGQFGDLAVDGANLDLELANLGDHLFDPPPVLLPGLALQHPAQLGFG